MENYISKLTDEEIEMLGKKIVRNKSLEMSNLTRDKSGYCMVEYKTTKNHTETPSINDKSRIFKLNLNFSDYEVDGIVNSLITLEKEKSMDRFVSLMTKKFGRTYAQKCYYYHKETMEICYKNKLEDLIKNGVLSQKQEKELVLLKKNIKIYLNHLFYVLNNALIESNEKELSLKNC